MTFMSEAEKERWEQRYVTGTYRPRTATSPFLAEWLPRIPTGRALDIACGAGRNSLAIAEAGFVTEAIDISPTAISVGQTEAERRGRVIDWRVADLDSLSLDASSYDLITCFRYRNRSLWPKLNSALAPDGWVVIEHHFKTPLEVAGPPSDDFRLDPGELLEAFSSLRVIHYSETFEAADMGGDSYAIERIVACNGNPGF